MSRSILRFAWPWKQAAIAAKQAYGCETKSGVSDPVITRIQVDDAVRVSQPATRVVAQAASIGPQQRADFPRLFFTFTAPSLRQGVKRGRWPLMSAVCRGRGA
jgi:hypothetical protein